MIITISGYDGAGKSTQVELLSKKICKEYNLKHISLFEINNEGELYQSVQDLDELYQKMCEYDVISTRFYLRSKRFQILQQKAMYSSESIFSDTGLIKTVAKLARKEAELWFKHVILKLNEQNKIIIFDRYFFDEIAYRCLYNIPYAYIEELYTGFIKPDISFYLALDNKDEVLKRNYGRDDMKTALFKCSSKMNELFVNLEYISNKYNMLRVRANGMSRETINELIMYNIKSLLYKQIMQHNK